MDAVSLPPSFLPHRSPQQVCSPLPLSLTAKSQSRNCKRNSFPRCCRIVIWKSHSQGLCAHLLLARRSGFEMEGSNGLSALKFACIDCHGRRGMKRNAPSSSEKGEERQMEDAKQSAPQKAAR